jgi:DNA-directed RNA polymerase specialized sigma24 family protein
VQRFGEERPAFHEEEGDQRLSTREQFDRLWLVAEAKLNHEQRTALWLRYAEGLSVGEIATILGRSQVGVRVLLFRVRQTLIAHLAPEADAPDESLNVRGVTTALGLERRHAMSGALT